MTVNTAVKTKTGIALPKPRPFADPPQEPIDCLLMSFNEVMHLLTEGYTVSVYSNGERVIFEPYDYNTYDQLKKIYHAKGCW